MEAKMFCFQCQEAAKGTGCTIKGVCGKDDKTANRMDLLLFVTKGIATVATMLHNAGIETSIQVGHFTTDALFSTITNANFDIESITKRIIKGLSLDIPAGKTTAIVGLSGSGKTTLIKLMLGFYPPTEGTVTIGRQSLQKISFKEWRKHCGVVMQEGFIFGDTIANNIVPDGNMIDKKRLLYAVEMANIRDFVESLPLKYNTKIGNTGQGLSQGQKQRILIARAIYRNPDYLFFDEATNALDTDNEKVIQGNLEKFFKDKTVVIVAHRLSTVKNADQIVVLKEGEITEKGTHDELITRQGDYYRLVKNQLELSA